MTLKASLRRYLTIFFVFGLSSNLFAGKSTPNRKAKWKSAVRTYFFSVLHIIILVTSVAIIIQWRSNMSVKSFGVTAHTILIFNKVATCTVALRLMPFFANPLNKLWARIHELEQFINHTIECKWTASRFTRRFNWDVCIVTTLLTSRFIARFMYRPPASYFQLIASFIPVIYACVSQFQVQFYLELYLSMLQSANEKLATVVVDEAFEHACGTDFLVQMKMLKNLHIRLWRVCNSLNASFSLILTSIIIQMIMNILPPLYALVVDLITGAFKEDLRSTSK